MKKMGMYLLGICLLFSLTSCKQKTDEPTKDNPQGGVVEKTPEPQGLITADFADGEVLFSVDYPAEWTLEELHYTEGNSDQESSRSVGIQFLFSKTEETFSIMAMLMIPFEVDETMFEAAAFQTDTGLTGTRFSNTVDGNVLVYYILGDGETLPQYIGAVSMSSENYEAQKDHIEATMKSLQIK